MKKTFLCGLALCLMVGLPVVAKAWDTAIMINNFSGDSIWVTYYYKSGCSITSKAYPSALAPHTSKDHGWSFDSGCRLDYVQVRKNNSSGSILGQCYFNQCGSTECPGVPFLVQYDPSFTSAIVYCSAGCSSYYRAGCWN